MSYTIANLKDDIQKKLHGTSLNKISGIFNACHEAAGVMLLKIDPRETVHIEQLDAPIYNNTYRYTAPVKMKMEKIIDLRPQVNRTQADSFSRYPNAEFEQHKGLQNQLLSVEYDAGERLLKIDNENIEPIVLHRMDSVTDNGTWSVGGDAENLTVDGLVKVAGSGSLNFDLSGAGATGYIENSTLTAQDTSQQEDIGALFSRVYMPNASAVTSVELRWGSDSSNYWSRTVTGTHSATVFQTGWNRLRFDWNGAIKTGTPAASAIDYLRVTVTYDGTADTDFRVDDVTVQTGEIYDIEFYSDYIFKNSSGLFIEKPTSDLDTIVLSNQTRNIFLYEVMLLLAQEVQGEDGVFDTTFFSNKLREAYVDYKSQFPSQVKKSRRSYYRQL